MPKGAHRGFRGVYRSLLWHVPFTVNPPLFLRPLVVERHGGAFRLAPMIPSIALKTAASRYAPLQLHLADRAGLDVPCLDRSFRPPSRWSVPMRSAFPPVHLSRRKQSRAEPHGTGIFHRTHAPKYENYFRAKPPFGIGIAPVHDKQKLPPVWPGMTFARVFCLQDRT